MFMRLRRAWWAFGQPIGTSLMVAPPPPRNMQEAVRSIVPTETPFMRKVRDNRDPPPWMNKRHRCDCGYTGGQCVDEPNCRRNTTMQRSRCDCGASASPEYCDGNCAFDEPVGDGVPTQLPPPPPERQQPGDEVLDAYEVAAREVEHDLKTLHAAMTIALDEGKGLAAEIRFRGEMERMHIRKQLELAKSLVLNFRDRRHQLNTNEAATTATEAVAMAM